MLGWALCVFVHVSGLSLAINYGNRSAVQWQMEEWSLTNTTWSGSAYDLDATATFEHNGSGDTLTSYLFYDENNTWKFRFTPTLGGTWTFSTASSDSDLNGHTGTVTVTSDPSGRGFVTNINQKWAWKGTEQTFVPQLVMLNYYLGTDAPSDYDNDSVIDAMNNIYFNQHGFNGYHQAAVGGYWFDYGRSDNSVNSSMTEPDPRTFRALERLIRKTHEAGGMVHIWCWGDSSRAQTPDRLTGGENGSMDRRLQKYIGSRLGPVPGWSMGYGFDLDEWANASQVKSWFDYVLSYSAYDHFMGGRPAGPNTGTDHSAYISWNQNLMYASYEHHQPTYNVYVAALNATPGKLVFSEDRFRWRVPAKYPNKDYDEPRTRRDLYTSTMAGGVANIWGRRENGGIYAHPEWFRTYKQFFYGVQRRFLPDMVRANHLSNNAYVLHSPSAKSYVLFREGANSIHIDLSSEVASLDVVAVNTIGGYSEVALGVLSPGQHSLSLPVTSDWAVAVGGFNQDGKYNLSVVNGDGDGRYDPGQVVTITADEAGTGEQFAYWRGDVSTVDDVNVASTTVMIPEYDIQVEAYFYGEPVIVRQPQHQYAIDGGSVIYSVIATGEPTPDYQWKLNGSDVGINSDTLQLDALQLSDNGGKVEVVVSNAMGTVFSDVARLTVTPFEIGAGEIIVCDSGSTLAGSGSSASFSVTNTGDTCNYLVVAAVSEFSNLTAMTFNSAPMAKLHGVASSDDMAFVDFYGISTTAASGMVEVTYNGDIWQSQIYGYVFMDGVDTDNPVRTSDGAFNMTGIGLMSLSYSSDVESGDFAMLACNKNNSHSSSVCPSDVTLYSGDAGASFSGTVAYDALLATGSYGSDFAFSVNSDREVAAGIILAAAGGMNPDVSGDGIVDLADIAMLSDQWQNVCGGPDWCNDADIDKNGAVDMDDLEILYYTWLITIGI